ncbi:prefoldin beta-like protein [Kipferlia bialata]|uniref:Prefoldin beta-like protein n=1 Tax=Kipferlia bialata TaxID=797122 RepID=A0A391NMS6_9EUKA|nr:prefoldin beta-like protein [Kipferlia bialata]|eukprot:g3009.t1
MSDEERQSEVVQELLAAQKSVEEYKSQLAMVSNRLSEGIRESRRAELTLGSLADVGDAETFISVGKAYYGKAKPDVEQVLTDRVNRLQKERKKLVGTKQYVELQLQSAEKRLTDIIDIVQRARATEMAGAAELEAQD